MRNKNATCIALSSLKKALSLCGSIEKLSLLTRISRGTLYRLANNKSGVTASTALKIQAFVEANINRPGRPFKTTNQKSKGKV